MVIKKLLAWIFYSSNIFALLSLGVVLFFGLSNLVYGFDILFIFFFIILPLILVVIIILAIKGYVVQVRLDRKVIKSVWLKRILYTGIIFVTWTITFFVGWATLDYVTDSPPQFFSFDDPHASYMITYENNMYWVVYESAADNSFAYCSTDANNKRICKMTVFIASSPVDLQPFTNKQVYLNGTFVTTAKQCIVTTCKDYGRFAGLRIDEIRLNK